MRQELRELARETWKSLLEGTSLKAQAMRGGVWLGAGYSIEQAVRLIRNIILARLLAPEVFGTMAIVMAVSAALEAFTEIGIKEAIIQSPKGQQRTYLSGAWWLSLLRASLIYILAFMGAPWIAAFYGNPELVPLIRVAFVGILFTGAISPRAYVAIKELNFARWVSINNVGGICGVLTAICLGFATRNVWALVIGFVAEGAARLILSYIICPYRPEMRFERETWGALSRYALGMIGIPVLTFLFMRSDIFVVGKLRSHADLGLYSMAATLAYAPCILLTTLIRQVAIPTFSRLQQEQEKLNRGVLNATAVVAYLGLPGLFFVGLYGADLLTIVYGSQYAAVATPFAIVFATALMSTSSAPIVAVYLAIGRPELHRLFTGIRAIVMLVLIVPAVKYFGLVGAAAAGLVAMSVGYIFQVLRIRQLTGLDPSQYLGIFLRASLISLCVAVTWFLKPHLPIVQPFLSILVGAAGCVLAYGVGLAICLRSGTAFSSQQSP